MELVNISQEVEFFEDVFMHKGVTHPAATCKTDFGIAWVNKQGCYLYDGEKVNNLLEKGGRQIISEFDWTAFTTREPMIGYIPKKRQLVIVDDNTATGAGDIFLYDLVTQSWVEGHESIVSHNLTNFITDWNGDLVFANTATSVLKWDDAGDTTTHMELKTKDIDFGSPGQKKSVKKVYLTYRGTGNHVEIYYGPDGGFNSTSYTFNNITSGTDGSTTGSGTAAKCIAYDAGTTDWLTAELKPSAGSVTCNSLAIRIRGDQSNAIGASFAINDISFVYRMKPVK